MLRNKMLNNTTHVVSEERKTNRRMHELPFGVSCKLVTQDGDSVYGTTAMEMRLQLLCSRTIIHLQETKSNQHQF